MPAALSLELKQLPGFFEAMARRGRATDFRKPLQACAVIAAAAARQCFVEAKDPDGRPWLPLSGLRARGGSRPLYDRGLLMNSVTGQVDGAGIVVGSNLQYARLHQFGGVILPKRAKALAIPLTPAAYRAGSPRRFGGELFMVWPKGKPHGWLAAPGKGKKPPVYHFLLVHSVRVPARPFLGWSAKTLAQIQDVLADAVRKQLEGP